jgi:hypothetical protein
MAVMRIWFDTRSGHIGFMVDKLELAHVFSQYILRFPLQILIPASVPHSLIILSHTRYNMYIRCRQISKFGEKISSSF